MPPIIDCIKSLTGTCLQMTSLYRDILLFNRLIMEKPMNLLNDITSVASNHNSGLSIFLTIY